MRGWLHLLWFAASLACGTLLIVGAHGAAQHTADAVYALSVTALFGTSALYHRGNWGHAWNRRLQRLDHVMIFFLIAGTATPAFLLAARGTAGLVCLSVMWAMTLTAAVIHLAWMGAPEVLVGAVFIGLGWSAGLALPEVSIHAVIGPGTLMIVGGLLSRSARLPTTAAGPTPFRQYLVITRFFTPRMRRRGLSVHRDHDVHRLSRRAWRRLAAAQHRPRSISAETPRGPAPGDYLVKSPTAGRMGKAAEYLIAAACVLSTRGELNVSTSMVDDDGVDLVFHRRDGVATLAVKSKPGWATVRTCRSAAWSRSSGHRPSGNAQISTSCSPLLI